MNIRKRDKHKKARLSLHNRDLLRNQMNLDEFNRDNKENEPEATGEEDTLAIFGKNK